MAASTCSICLEDNISKQLHNCKTCSAITCLSCANNWAFSKYNLGCHPTCAFCRSSLDLFVIFKLFQAFKADLEEAQVGEKRKAAEDLYCDEKPLESPSWASEDIPPLSWRTYFKLCGLEPASMIPDNDTGPIAFLTYDLPPESQDPDLDLDTDIAELLWFDQYYGQPSQALDWDPDWDPYLIPRRRRSIRQTSTNIV